MQEGGDSDTAKDACLRFGLMSSDFRFSDLRSLLVRCLHAAVVVAVAVVVVVDESFLDVTVMRW